MFGFEVLTKDRRLDAILTVGFLLLSCYEGLSFHGPIGIKPDNVGLYR